MDDNNQGRIGPIDGRGLHRLDTPLDAHGAQVLQRIVAKRDISYTEAVRRAIGIRAAIAEFDSEGAQATLISGDGTRTALLAPTVTPDLPAGVPLSVNLNTETAEALVHLHLPGGDSFAEVIRQGAVVYERVWETQEGGGQVSITRDGAAVRTLVLM